MKPIWIWMNRIWSWMLKRWKLLLKNTGERDTPIIEDIRPLDKNEDDELSVIELAIHFALQREDEGIEALDQWSAYQLVRKHDKNKDGSLEQARILPVAFVPLIPEEKTSDED